MTYRIFTMKGSSPLSSGTEVLRVTLKGAGITIPAILVGERGRGRELGVLPVQLTPEQFQEWEERGGNVTITAASVGITRAGKPKLFASPEGASSTEYALCVLRTKIGYRGSNEYTGDLKDEWWNIDTYYSRSAKDAGIPLKERYAADEVREYSPHLMNLCCGDGNWRWDAGFDKKSKFEPFPGKVLAKGIIAQGAAGRMGSGEQLVALLPRNTVWRTGYSGRLYGAANHHYHIWNGDKLISATREERELADLF